MSIAAAIRKDLRSFRSLINFDTLRCFSIKVLKDLENGTTRFSIDIKVLKDLKTYLVDRDRGGQAPALREHRDQEVSPTERIEI